MNAFWPIDEASLAGLRGSQPGAAAAQATRPETTAPFLAQIEQLLGEETEPDTAFFMDSWTVGVAAASENFLRRQEDRKCRERATPSWATYPFFTPFFVAGVEAPAEPSWPLREQRSAQDATAHLRWVVDEQAAEEQREAEQALEDQADIGSPLTLDAACRMLGVTVASTREQIRAAYRRLASRYHPDRLARAGQCEQQRASDRMATINEAYRMVCAGLVATH